MVTGQKSEPDFLVGDVPVYGDLILAPMTGFSDLPFRMIARSFGSSMGFTAFVNAIEVVKNQEERFEERLAYDDCERPVVFQIFDHEPDRILSAALLLRERNPDIIDVNMGCSTRRVSQRGAGAGLLREPLKIAEIFNKLSRTLDIPITGKIRLGWDNDNKNYLSICRIIEDNGGALIAVHGRTREQKFDGNADWEAIAEIKQAVSIPVIGNGDVQMVRDVDRIIGETRCDAVMIGRAAIGNPWIFSRIDRCQVADEKVRHVMKLHLEIASDFYGPERGIMLFRKHASRYLEPYPLNREQRRQLFRCTNPEEFSRDLDEFVFNAC